MQGAPGSLLGLGAVLTGFVMTLGPLKLNVFAEPRWTVAHEGAGQPKFQVLAGVNLQFPIGK